MLHRSFPLRTSLFKKLFWPPNFPFCEFERWEMEIVEIFEDLEGKRFWWRLEWDQDFLPTNYVLLFNFSGFKTFLGRTCVFLPFLLQISKPTKLLDDFIYSHRSLCIDIYFFCILLEFPSSLWKSVGYFQSSPQCFGKRLRDRSWSSVVKKRWELQEKRIHFGVWKMVYGFKDLPSFS